MLDTAVMTLKAEGRHMLPGAQAFLLHDTYGFPIDLTLEMAAEQDVEVDREGFRALMLAQRERARADARARKAGSSIDTSALRSVLNTHGPTDWLAWESLTTESRVLAVPGADGTVAVARSGEVVTVILDRSPFYAESGGQESDAGVFSGTSVEAEVLDVQRSLPGLVAHQVRVTVGELAPGDVVQAAVDADWRPGRHTRGPMSCMSRCVRFSAPPPSRQARTTGPATSASTSPGAVVSPRPPAQRWRMRRTGPCAEICR